MPIRTVEALSAKCDDCGQTLYDDEFNEFFRGEHIAHELTRQAWAQNGLQTFCRHCRGQHPEARVDLDETAEQYVAAVLKPGKDLFPRWGDKTPTHRIVSLSEDGQMLVAEDLAGGQTQWRLSHTESNGDIAYARVQDWGRLTSKTTLVVVNPIRLIPEIETYDATESDAEEADSEE